MYDAYTNVDTKTHRRIK